jgi:hypothetical protein
MEPSARPESPACSVSSADFGPERIQAQVDLLQAVLEANEARRAEPSGSARVPGEGLCQPHGPLAGRQADAAGPQMRGRPLSADRVATYLEAQRQIAAGVKFSAVARRLHLGSSTLDNMFSRSGQLLLTARGAQLRGMDAAQRQAVAALPRALRATDLANVVNLLWQQLGRPPQELLAAGRRAGIPGAVLDHLFDENGLRQEHVQALPATQRDALRSALIRPPAQHPQQRITLEIPPERLAALSQAQQRLAQGVDFGSAAALVNLPESALRSAFSADGRLLVTREGQALLERAVPRQRAAFEALPRALRSWHVSTLAACLREAASTPGTDPRVDAAQAGVPDEVLAFLFGDNGLRDDRLAALPQDQLRVLQAARAGQPAASGLQTTLRADTLARAQRLERAVRLLQAGVPREQAAQQAGVGERSLRGAIDREGRLLITAGNEFLFQHADGRARAPLEALQRALIRRDLVVLVDVMRRHMTSGLPNLRQAAADAGLSGPALNHLFNGEVLRVDRIAALPEAQKNALLLPEASLPSTRGARMLGPAHVQVALRNAQQLIAGGTERHVVAAQLDLPQLSSFFDRSGRLMLNDLAAGLLRLGDDALRTHFAALPRALGRSDLSGLAAVLRENAHDPFPDLFTAAAEMGVGQQALAHLFEGNQFREDRLAGLPPDQVHTLQQARSGLPQPEPQPAQAQPRTQATGSRHAAAAPAVRSGGSMPGAAQLIDVLRFFQEQPGVHAFGQAQHRFRMGPERLMGLLARAGVSEQEARLGDIPSPAVLWRRLAATDSRRPLPADRAVAPGDLDAFAASLQELLDSPAEQGSQAHATSRKRAAQTPLPGEPSGSRARPDAGEEAVLVSESPGFEAGLPDPGAPTFEDLAWLSQGQADPMYASFSPESLSDVPEPPGPRPGDRR